VIHQISCTSICRPEQHVGALEIPLGQAWHTFPSSLLQPKASSCRFAAPSSLKHGSCLQNPAYMVFACLVADQDLLFVTYEVPCISICRAEQRAKALERLGMPASVYQDINDRGGNAPIVVRPFGDKPGVRGKSGGLLAEEDKGVSLVDTWNKVAQGTGSTGAFTTPVCSALSLFLAAE
jgi:hypothetical protein